MTNVANEKVIGTVKQWLTPGLISIVGMMLWGQLSELKTDVKTLLINQGVTQTRITILEKEMDFIKRNQLYTQSVKYNERPVAKKEDEPRVPEPEVYQDMHKKSN